MAMFMFIDCYGHESQLDDNDGQYDDAILTEVLQGDITVEREIERERPSTGSAAPTVPLHVPGLFLGLVVVQSPLPVAVSVSRVRRLPLRVGSVSGYLLKCKYEQLFAK